MMHCAETHTNGISSAPAEEDFHKRLRRLYPCVEDVSKLPQAWSTEFRAPQLGFTSDNLCCYFKGGKRGEEDEKSAAAVRTENCIHPSCLLYYFEIKWVSKGREGFMGLGLTTAHAPLSKLPGWAPDSYGYHADDGNIFNNDGRGVPFGPTFTTGDIVGCGYNLVEGKCFFTKNGINLGKAFEEISGETFYYPTVGLKTSGEEIEANFGQKEFMYDIEQDLRSLQKNMTLTISDYPISDFARWQDTLHKLLQSWLLHNSYPRTAAAFTRATKLECKEDMQRLEIRNRIQQLVLSGKISETIRATNHLCPGLLQNNPNLLFALKCRQFIELISGADNDFQPLFDHTTNATATIAGVESNGAKVTNGLAKIDAKGDQARDVTSTSSGAIAVDAIKASRALEGKMDLDDQKYAKLILFGQELFEFLQQLDKLYGKNAHNEKLLQDAVGLIAFANPKDSFLAKLMDPSEREPISQLLNNFIVRAEMGESHKSPLEDVMNHLRSMIRLNDSHGNWLIDQLYFESGQT